MSGQLLGAPAAGQFAIIFHYVGLSNSGMPGDMGSYTIAKDRPRPSPTRPKPTLSISRWR